jgi:hypothetical protein
MELRDKRKYTGEMKILEPCSAPLNDHLIAGIGTGVAVEFNTGRVFACSKSTPPEVRL